MPELKVEDVKKDLQGMVDVAKKQQETLLPDEEKKVLEETRKKEQEAQVLADAQAKKDAELLAKKPEELSEEEKKRRDIVAEGKRKEEEEKLSAEEKLKRTQEAMQKRIDELVNESKQTKDKTAKEIEAQQKELSLLRQENETLAKKISQPEKTDPTVLLRQKEQERLSQYLEEDAALPREQRREMPEEELQEWFDEDRIKANRWIAQQELRRSRERATDQREIQEKDARKNQAQKWLESHARVIIRHPELDTDKREAELKAQGKTGEEIETILCQENEKYRLVKEISRANIDYLRTTDNAPELVVKEMEKRLAVKSSTPAQTEAEKRVEELAKRIEELEAQLQEAQMSEPGVNSTVTRIKQAADKLTEQENFLVETMKSAGAPQANIDIALKNLKANQGKS